MIFPVPGIGPLIRRHGAWLMAAGAGLGILAPDLAAAANPALLPLSCLTMFLALLRVEPAAFIAVLRRPGARHRGDLLDPACLPGAGLVPGAAGAAGRRRVPARHDPDRGDTGHDVGGGLWRAARHRCRPAHPGRAADQYSGAGDPAGGGAAAGRRGRHRPDGDRAASGGDDRGEFRRRLPDHRADRPAAHQAGGPRHRHRHHPDGGGGGAGGDARGGGRRWSRPPAS